MGESTSHTTSIDDRGKGCKIHRYDVEDQTTIYYLTNPDPTCQNVGCPEELSSYQTYICGINMH